MPSLRKQVRHAAARNSVLMRLVLVAVLVAVLVICWRWGGGAVYRHAVTVPLTPESLHADFSRLEISAADRDTDAAQAKRVSLDEVSEELAITAGGDYLLAGSLDGTIRVDAHEEIVHLFLDGVNVHAGVGPALLVEDADRVVITLTDGSENVLADSGDYHDVPTADACVYSACDLTFNGSGKLIITGLYQDAVHGRDAVKIVSGEYRIESKRSGLRGNDGVHLAGGELFIGSEKYGLRTTKQGENGRGDILVHDCTLRIVAGRYGFVADRADAYLYSAAVQMNCVIDDFSVQGRIVAEDGCIV